jgi:hypothetical protein
MTSPSLNPFASPKAPAPNVGGVFVDVAGFKFHVTARAIPRYLWTTTDIRVAIDGRTVLSTGGVLKTASSARAEFEQEGKTRNRVAVAARQGVRVPLCHRRGRRGVEVRTCSD